MTPAQPPLIPGSPLYTFPAHVIPSIIRQLDIDHKFSARFTQSAAAIFGQLMMQQAAPLDDLRHATDYNIIVPQWKTIGLRIRRAQYAFGKEKKSGVLYTAQFVIRAEKASGIRTEYDKIRDGYMDVLLYAFAANDLTADIAHWVLLDMNVFRSEKRLDFYTARAYRVWNEIDGSLGKAYNIAWFSPDLVIARGLGSQVLYVRP
jgi:hypothetical protein